MIKNIRVFYGYVAGHVDIDLLEIKKSKKDSLSALYHIRPRPLIWRAKFIFYSDKNRNLNDKIFNYATLGIYIHMELPLFESTFFAPFFGLQENLLDPPPEGPVRVRG